MEQMRKKALKEHLYTIIKVARDQDFFGQIGRDIYFDLVDHDRVHSFRIQKRMSFNLFKEEAAKVFGIPAQFQRFWMWAMRQNQTCRPHRRLTPEEEAQCVGQLGEVSNKAKNAELKLFLEVELGQVLRPVHPPAESKEDILLFFKLYDPLKEDLRYVGRLFVKANGKPVEIVAKLNELAGFSPHEEITLFEEIRFEPNIWCDLVDKNITFRGSQLGDGDIICYQKPAQVYNSDHCCYPDICSFLEYVHHRQRSDMNAAREERLLGPHAANEDSKSQNAIRIDVTGISGEVNPLQPVGQDLASTEALNVDEEAKPVPFESTIIDHSTDTAPAGKVRFLAYWVSSEASLLLGRIQGLHKDTFTKFSMKGHTLQTVLLESFALFIESMLTTKVNEVNEEALGRYAISVEDFEGVGLDLSWLKQRLDEAKRVNKRLESLTFVDLCECALRVALAKVRELEEGLVKAKAELEDRSQDLPNSLGADDFVLKDVV